MVLNLDADLIFSDWTKQTWDLPFEYGSEEFYEWLEGNGMTLAEFKKLPVYTLALRSGSISEEKARKFNPHHDPKSAE